MADNGYEILRELPTWICLPASPVGNACSAEDGVVAKRLLRVVAAVALMIQDSSQRAEKVLAELNK
jgi:hypothetical protein